MQNAAVHRSLRILGIRGIPASHGGFETFAERLAVWLVGRGWDVTVYCQENGDGPPRTGSWHGVRLVHVPVPFEGSRGSIVFDWRSVRHASRETGVVLTLGYNTALFGRVYRRRGVPHVVNMDGIEWRRAKWSAAVKLWFRFNERYACRTADHLVADHPEIKNHLARHVPADRITTIPYGADAVASPDEATLAGLDLRRDGYALVVARPEPENSLLEIVTGYSARPRGHDLVVLGDLRPEERRYDRAARDAAGPGVRFLGAIYDRGVLDSLRAGTRAYIHGHRVGGTNPSLVEAMGAGSAVLAHDNRFNRWVAGDGARYFRSARDVDDTLTALLPDDGAIARMRDASRQQFRARFRWEGVLQAYEALLERYAARAGG